MIALKTLRADLGAHLATGLSAAHAKLGAQVNPPAVEIRPGTPYVNAQDYCTDVVLFQATIVTKPGDPPAVVDALDDLVDLVRSTLKNASTNGNRFSFRGVNSFITVNIGEAELPGVVVDIVYERTV